MTILPEALQYNVLQWNIYGDLKVDWYVDGFAKRLCEVLLLLMPLG
jgi:hypothetical protein